MNGGTPRSYVVECYLPGVRRADVEDTAGRLSALCGGRPQRGASIKYGGAILLPGDEVVLHLFGADAEDAVRDACQLAGVEHERILETVQVLAGASAEAAADA